MEIEVKNSSLIKNVSYNFDSCELTVFFKSNYYSKEITYIDVPHSYFEELINSKSFGKFYLQMIKPIFKQKNLKTMSEEKKQPKRINKASEKKRFIKIDISVHKDKINKDWLFVTEKGDVRLKMTLHMLPDGETDQYGRLGMITQDVPAELAKQNKELRGAILGNAEELQWEGQGEATPLSSKSDAEKALVDDDLPF